MSSIDHPNKRLIQAIEDGKIDLMQRALDDGADPNARKRVHLTIPVVVDTIVLKKGGLFSKKRQEEVMESYQDSHSGESALGIAVLSGRADVVQLLLDAGANPNVHVEWRIAGWGGEWTKERYDRERWSLRVDFPSPLALALANGRTLKINKRGGEVKIVNPLSMSQSSDVMELRSSIEVVRVLLEGGAMVTTAMLEAARAIKDKIFIQTIEEHLASGGGGPPQTNPVPPPRSLPKKGSASLSSSNTLNSREDSGSPPAQHVRSETAGASSTNRRQRTYEELEAECDDLRTQNTELSTRNSDLQIQNRRLASQNTQLQARVADLESQLGAARLMNSSNSAPTTPVSAPATFGNGFGSPLPFSQTTTPSANGGAVPLKQVLYAHADYMPTSPDEIMLARGQNLFGNVKYPDAIIRALARTSRNVIAESSRAPQLCRTAHFYHPSFRPPNSLANHAMAFAAIRQFSQSSPLMQRLLPANEEIERVLLSRFNQHSSLTNPAEVDPSGPPFTVDIVADGGNRVGPITLEEALKLTKEKGPGYELVLVNARVNPPICRLRAVAPDKKVAEEPWKSTTKVNNLSGPTSPQGLKADSQPSGANVMSTGRPSEKVPRANTSSKPANAQKEAKELQMGTGISKNDLYRKVELARGWLESNKRVLIKVVDKHKGMPGGGAVNQEKVIRSVIKDLSDVGVLVGQLRREGLKTLVEMKKK
ncbi:hypothetical protein HDU93_008982 [Gonapodya sp. JEL0774]|nr:hypothetical protein HDU93_008982 [Gonapodya sp. JEL0774]